MRHRQSVRGRCQRVENAWRRHWLGRQRRGWRRWGRLSDLHTRNGGNPVPELKGREKMTMLRRLFFAWIVAVAFMPTAEAQNIVSVPSYSALTPTPSGLSPYFLQYNCNTVTLTTSSICYPLVQVFNAAPTGPQIPSVGIAVTVTPTQITTDPCTLGGGVGGSISKIPFNVSGTGTIQLVPPQSSPPAQVYLCTLDINTVAAATVNLTAGLGATCTTGSPTTLAGPMSFPALALWQRGNGGATVYRTAISGHGICVSASTGVITASGTEVQQ